MHRAVRLEKNRPESGKLKKVQSQAEICTVTPVHRLCVVDKNSYLKFLVDTGANISVLPATRKQLLSECDDYKLYAANGTEIKTYGVKTLNLDFGLRRPYQWSFVLANVKQPILGADFLAHHKILVDVNRMKLIDSVTSLQTIASVTVHEQPTVRTIYENEYSDILSEFPNITKPMCFKSSPQHSIVHYIETTGSAVYARPRPLPPDKYSKVKAEFQRMQEMGICRPSKSNWASPLHVVTKKNGELRPCGDYRKLNAQTKPDRYPIPRIQDCNYLLHNKSIYTRIDMQRAYFNILINEKDIPKTAITTPFGLYEFLRMGFGLRNAAQTFQRFLHDEVLRDLDYIFVYIDDVIIASESEIVHKRHVREVLSRLDKYGITINIAKCDFGKTDLNFLGYHVSKGGISPMAEQVKVISEFPRPKSVDQLRRFLGMINFYRRHIPKAAEIQSKLNIFLHNTKKKDTSLIPWTDEATEAFEQCKQSLQNAVKLSFPSSDAQIALMTDCSDKCAGAVLQQKDIDGWKPLGFFSTKLSETQQRYSTYDRELLAIYLAIKHFRYLIEGRTFTIYTDHKPIVYSLQNNTAGKNDTPRRIRHLDFIMQFCTEIKHISGRENTVADCLSRISAIDVSPLDYEKLAEAQCGDIELENLMKLKSLQFNKIFIPNCNKPIQCDVSLNRVRPYLPKEFRVSAFNAVHGISHPGTRPTRKMMQDRYIWQGMNKDVTQWVKGCLECQKSKVQRHTVSPLGHFVQSDRFEHLHMDIVGPLTYCDGYRYVVTMVDRKTGWPEAYPVKDITAESIADIMYSGWISRFGCPLNLTTDQGSTFLSQLFTHLAKRMGINKFRTTAYHPQSNGMVERWHRSLKAALMCRGNTGQWVLELPTVLLGLRSCLRDDTQISAAEMVLGEAIRLPGDFFQPLKQETSDNVVFVQELRKKIAHLASVPRKELHQGKIFVHPELKDCTHVFVRVDKVSRPLTQPFMGPYRVISKTEKYFKIMQGQTQKVISIDRLKPAYFIKTEECIDAPNKATNVNNDTRVSRFGRTIKPVVRFTV